MEWIGFNLNQGPITSLGDINILNASYFNMFSRSTTDNFQVRMESTSAEATLRNSGTTANIKINPGNSLYLYPVTGTIYGNKFGNSDDDTRFAWGNNGDLKITTQDLAGTAAHFEIEADGAIVLDAATDVEIEATILNYETGTFKCGAGAEFTGGADFISTTGSQPRINISNTGNNTSGGVLNFKLDKGAAGADGDIPGTINFQSDNDAQQSLVFASIVGAVADATDGQEAGGMALRVMEYDGTMTTGLELNGDTNADGEVDVTIGAGAASTTTVAGNLQVTTGLELGHASDTTLARSSSGVMTVEGKEVRTIDRHLKIVNSSFKDDIGTDEHYIPWHTEDENTSNTNENIPFIAPYAGKLLELHYRVSTNTSGATATWRLVQIEKTEVINTANNTILDTQTCTGPTNAAGGAGNLVKVTFDDDAAFNAGDMIALSIQHDTDVTGSSDKFYVTTIWEYDLSSM